MQFTPCRACGNPVGIGVSACLRCGTRVFKPTSPIGVLGAIIGGLVIAGYVGHLVINSGSSQPAIVVQTSPPAPVFVAPIAPQQTPATMAAAKAQYEHDRDAVRKAKPKTEEDIVKLLGRRPDNIIETGTITMLQWFYESKAVGRDVLQVAIEGGKITIMNL
jgi:hypothetical protein